MFSLLCLFVVLRVSHLGFEDRHFKFLVFALFYLKNKRDCTFYVAKTKALI